MRLCDAMKGGSSQLQTIWYMVTFPPCCRSREPLTPLIESVPICTFKNHRERVKSYLAPIFLRISPLGLFPSGLLPHVRKRVQ